MLLLEKGVPHLPRTIHSETPAQLARRGGHIDTAKYLGNLIHSFVFNLIQQPVEP